MASAPVSEWLCEPCEKDGEVIKARTHCFECRELLCEPCSISHLRFKLTENHHLLELVQFMKKSTSHHDPSSSKQTSSSINEDELASDFLEHVTLTENTVLYRGAQVAVQSTASKSSKHTTSRPAGSKRDKATLSVPSKPTTSEQADSKRDKATLSVPSKPTTSEQANSKRDKATLSVPSKPTTSEQADSKRDKATLSVPSKPTTSEQADSKRDTATLSVPSKPTTSEQADSKRDKATLSVPSKPTTSEQADSKRHKATLSVPSKPTTSEQADSKRDKATPSVPSKRTTSRQSDPRRLTATQCLQYSVKRPEDEVDVYVTGVLCVSHNVVVVDYNNNVLKLFDQSGTYLSSTALKAGTWGITCVGDSTFATCGGKTVYLWSVRGHTVVSEDVYHVDHIAQGIHYNGTYYCVLHQYNNTITVLDRQGRQVREINMEEGCGKKFTFGWDIHMDSDTHNIYVPCRDEDGVLCMTVEGGALWFTPLSYMPWGITEIQGTLCAADLVCLHMITKEGEYVRELLDKEDLGGRPTYVCYRQDGKLYVSYFGHDKISVFTFT